MEARLLGPGFFAEMRGVGLADVAERDDAYAFVRAAFEEHSVLLFRGQPVTDELQVAYSKRFGPLEIAKVASLGEGTPFSILTNIDRATGKLVPPDHKEALRARQARESGKSRQARGGGNAVIPIAFGVDFELADTRLLQRCNHALPESLRPFSNAAND